MAEPWKKRLQPWAERWWELQRDIEAWMRESTDEELIQIERDVVSPNSTNCWFATFEVAHLIREALTAERYRRQQARAADPSTPPAATEHEYPCDDFGCRPCHAVAHAQSSPFATPASPVPSTPEEG